MNKDMLNAYRRYAGTDEAIAIRFVQRNIPLAKAHWVDIVEYRRYEKSPHNMHFRFVVGGLYQRKIQPQYPSKSLFTSNGTFDESQYMLTVRAITWETARKDVKQQSSKRITPRKFKITGVSYDKNRGNSNFFREDAPPEIKALEANINDRTNPLWDSALQYANKPEFVYEIKRIYVAPKPS